MPSSRCSIRMTEPDENLLLPEGNAVRSVDRAATLLLALGEMPAEAGVTELARRLALHKSTVSRLLATLEKRGLVEQDEESGKYRLGLVILRLAEQAERTLDLRGLAMPELQRLARTSHETVSLGVLRGESVLTLAQAEGVNHGDRSRSGRLLPAHAVASGKALLATLPEREVMRIARGGLQRHTARTLVELEPILEDLARTRRRGFATAIGELDEGTATVAAPILDHRGDAIAAVEIQAPATRVPPQRLPELAAQVRSSANAISSRLGGGHETGDGEPGEGGPIA